MKVKVICDNGDIKKAEEELNEFIKNKVIYDIRYSQLAVPTAYRNGNPSTMALINSFMIMYDNPEDVCKEISNER